MSGDAPTAPIAVVDDAGARPAGPAEAAEPAQPGERSPWRLRPRPTWWPEVAAAAGLAAVAFVAGLTRQRGEPAWRTIWAEDGSIYLQQALDEGPVSVLFRGYAGYLQLPCRLLALPVRHLSPAQWPVWFAVSSAAVTALVVAAVYVLARGWIASRPLRAVVAASVVLGPGLASENLANAAYIPWAFLAALPWAILSYAERPAAVAVRAVLAFLAATASLLSIILLPLAVGWLAVRRTRATAVVTAVFLVGLGVQIVAARQSSLDVAAADSSVGDLAEIFGVFVLAQLLVGNRFVDNLWIDGGMAFVAACFLVTAVVAGLLAWRSDRRRRVLALVLMVLGAVIFVVPLWGRGTSLSALTAGAYHQAGMRYAVVPAFLLVCALAVLADAGERASPPRWTGWAAVRAALVAQVCAVFVISFAVRNPRSDGPDVVDEARQASEWCASQSRDTPVYLSVSPGGAWSVATTCHQHAPAP
jgi:hypothetical protein